ncbi:MAG: ATP-binding cassette domain-containing protein [Ectothiorhodospiraceae bacterium]|nr:ATP-binding cassette domain-containing protein [Ectothiorhodospiraceae bacterium]
MNGNQHAILQAKGLETRLGGNLIHQNLDLDVRPGEILAIVGGSGSGKTVLLRELILLLRPTRGTIHLFGRDCSHVSPDAMRKLREQIGVMFQHGALFTGMSVAENVMLPMQEHTRLRRSTLEELAMIKIRLAGLPPEAAARKPSELSGGMVKRAALARALALDPELLFLDEPTAGLDPVSAGAFDDRILELRELLGLTVVMITHDMDSLWRATDRVAFLADRRVVANQPIAELTANPHPAIQAYFAGPRARDRRIEQ